MLGVNRYQCFQAATILPVRLLILLTLPAVAQTESAKVEIVTPRFVQQIPKIEVFGSTEPEDLKRPPKTPLQKMRESLDKVEPKVNFLVRDYVYNDGTRKAQIKTLAGLFCLEEKRGQIDFSGINRARIGVAMSPVINDCR